MPPNAFVAADDYANASALVDHLNYLMDSPIEYMRLLDWRSKWSLVPPFSAPTKNFLTGREHKSERFASLLADCQFLGLCTLCERLAQEANTIREEPIVDIRAWYERNSPCSAALNESWFLPSSSTVAQLK